ncbi:hypothetical protein LEWO105114_05225 [Legionella worsleiensis]|nr:Uncharacterised protein [Legionella worsleiensis]
MCFNKSKLPSDYKILKTIYKMYFDAFISFNTSNQTRESVYSGAK